MIELNGNIAMYGAGNVGIKVFDTLKKLSITPVCFIDKNKNGSNINGLKVISIEEASKENIDIVIVSLFSPDKESDLKKITEYLNSFGFYKIITFEEFYQSIPDIFSQNIYWIAPISFFESEIEKIDNARKLFKEKKSLDIYNAQIKHRLGASYDVLPYPDYDFIQYIPEDIPIPKSPYSFIDIGAFDGDTILQFLDNGIEFNKIAAFEPDIKNFKRLTENMSNLKVPEIYLFPVGCNSQCSRLSFNEKNCMSSGFCSDGAINLPVVSVDSVLKGFCPNYIKMDVEGFEMQTILGLREIISEYKPSLAIATYHLPDDIYSIPSYLNDNFGFYDFYLRMHYSHCFETVLYAINNNNK